ncbi:MAG: hypothetical protein ABJB66_09700, partial [Gemmatimonadaceae bacterium]
LRRIGIDISRVASFDVAFEHGRDWSATLLSVTHRRTGLRTSYTVQFSGESVNQQFVVIELTEPFAQPVTLGISDFPENEARQLLLRFTNGE